LIRNGTAPGSLELVLDGVDPIELDAELMVEQRMDDGTFLKLQHLDLSSMKLFESCTHDDRKCVQVDARGIRPVPWSGMSCSSQCNGNCDKNVPQYGTFRFAVKTCDGSRKYEGPLFTRTRITVPKSGKTQ
jgi:hypothetical protein